jgi:hypothetical protein
VCSNDHRLEAAIRHACHSVTGLRPSQGLPPNDAIMPTYRLVFIDDRENLLWSRHVECWSDDRAIEMAMQEEGSHLGVQVWEGERPVCLVGNPRGTAAMLD